MNISEVAEASGLPSKTIRYYEDINLINPGRSANGYRVFRPSDVHKLMFLARSRSLGFSIEDCRALLGLWEDQDRANLIAYLVDINNSDICGAFKTSASEK